MHNIWSNLRRLTPFLIGAAALVVCIIGLVTAQRATRDLKELEVTAQGIREELDTAQRDLSAQGAQLAGVSGRLLLTETAFKLHSDEVTEAVTALRNRIDVLSDESAQTAAAASELTSCLEELISYFNSPFRSLVEQYVPEYRSPGFRC
jgi:hypothetical protein